MPFTPFHFGPSACIAFPLQRKVDLPVFILTNVVIDIEPLLVILFNFNYPVHGLAHTFIGASLVGIASGAFAYALRRRIGLIMELVKLSYQHVLSRALLSGVFGAWFHVLLDSMLYPDIKPFYPLTSNPLLDLIGYRAMYAGCAIAFIPALILYFHYAKQYRKTGLEP